MLKKYFTYIKILWSKSIDEGAHPDKRIVAARWNKYAEKRRSESVIIQCGEWWYGESDIIKAYKSNRLNKYSKEIS